MAILCIVLAALGALVCAAGGIWQLVAAFRRSLAWGLSVLLVPGANLVFLFYDWQASKGPFVAVIVGLMLLGGSLSISMSIQRHGGAAPNLPLLGGGSATPAPRAHSAIADEGIFKAKKDAELQIKLVSLRQRETELLQRKAELAPDDRAGRLALAGEIKKYNADRDLLAQQMKEAPAPAK